MERNMNFAPNSLPDLEAENRPELVAVVPLGEGNIGTISGSHLIQGERDNLLADITSPERHKNATNEWDCVDGRGEDENTLPVVSECAANPQTAGGLAITEVAVELLASKNVTKPISQLMAENTVKAIENKQAVVMHGDHAHGEAGCGACAALASGEALHNAHANRDVAAPLAIATAQALGIGEHVSEDDAYELIANGANNSNSTILDASPEQLVAIAVENGARYKELAGKHREALVLAKLSEGAVDKEAISAHNIDSEGNPIMAFVATMGEYKKYAFETGRAAGSTDSEISKRVLATIIWNLAVSKRLVADKDFAVALVR